MAKHAALTWHARDAEPLQLGVQIYAAPWARAKYEWIMHHAPYGTALRVEEMALNLGADIPSIGVAFESGVMGACCGDGWIVITCSEDK